MRQRVGQRVCGRGWGRGYVGGGEAEGEAEGVWEGVRQRVGQRVCGRGWDSAEDDHVRSIIMLLPGATVVLLGEEASGSAQLEAAGGLLAMTVGRGHFGRRR